MFVLFSEIGCLLRSKVLRAVLAFLLGTMCLTAFCARAQIEVPQPSAGILYPPDGAELTLRVGEDPLDISLSAQSGGFTFTMMENIFFGPEHVFDQIFAPTGFGVKHDFLISTADMPAGTDTITIVATFDSTGEVFATSSFVLTLIRAENPELTSPTHSLGQISSIQVLTVEWETPWAYGGVGGYSYTIVSQDDPIYDVHRTPDDTIDLDASATSFTTQPLEPGHIWEFNIRTIDSEGWPATFYSSFWVEIASASVIITRPQSSDVFDMGDWVDVYWEAIDWGGDDVSARYDVDTIDLFKGSDFTMTVVLNQANTGWAGFTVPNVFPSFSYNVRVILDRNAAGDMFPELPETIVGFSDNFYIKMPESIESCDALGVTQDSFYPSEDLYVVGSGHIPSILFPQSYPIYVVEDTTWNDGMAIPTRVPGTATSVSSNAVGNIGPTLVWSNPLIPGRFDIVVDANKNNLYDEGIDALDDRDVATSAGFSVGIIVDVMASDSSGVFTVTIDAEADKGVPVTSWSVISTVNIASHDITLTDGDLVIEGQLEDPDLEGQIVLEVDPEDEIITYQINIAPYEEKWLYFVLVGVIAVVSVIAAYLIYRKKRKAPQTRNP